MTIKGKNWGQDCKLKIQRATKHIEELEQIEKGMQALFSPKWSFNGGRLSGTFEGISASESTGVIVGDAVHNLRSVLDILACELVELNAKSADKVRFPFGNSREGFKKELDNSNFKRAGDKCIAIVTQLSPYPGGNDELRLLHDLDIHDKHRNIIPQLAAQTSPSFTFDENGRMKIVGPPQAFFIFPEGSIGEGKEVIKTLKTSKQMTIDIATRLYGAHNIAFLVPG